MNKQVNLHATCTIMYNMLYDALVQKASIDALQEPAAVQYTNRYVMMIMIRGPASTSGVFRELCSSILLYA